VLAEHQVTETIDTDLILRSYLVMPPHSARYFDTSVLGA